MDRRIFFKNSLLTAGGLFMGDTALSRFLEDKESVENPRTGHITAKSYGEIIIDENIKAPGDCELKLWKEQTCFSA